jgi:hypothetical protein
MSSSFQRVVTTEEEDPELRKVANSVPIKVSKIVSFPYL